MWTAYPNEVKFDYQKGELTYAVGEKDKGERERDRKREREEIDKSERKREKRQRKINKSESEREREREREEGKYKQVVYLSNFLVLISYRKLYLGEIVLYITNEIRKRRNPFSNAMRF